MNQDSSVPDNSRYVPLTQQKWCCVPTCIQMVMLRHKIPLLPAEQMGYEMGLVVPNDAKEYFWNVRTGPRPTSGYGTQAQKPQHNPNSVFKRLHIPLKMSWSLIGKFKSIDNVRVYLAEAEVNGKDTLICFDWPALFDENNKDHWGHVCVLDRVFIKQDEVRVIDPEVNVPKWRSIQIEKLYHAMVVHGDHNGGGFWELTPGKAIGSPHL